MLTRIDDILVPHGMPRSLLDFIKENNGETRFWIGGFIEEASNYRFFYDVGHIAVRNHELMIHSQQHSHPYHLYLYAWDHVYCLMPNAKRLRAKKPGWLANNAHRIITEPDFPRIWDNEQVEAYIDSHHGGTNAAE